MIHSRHSTESLGPVQGPEAVSAHLTKYLAMVRQWAYSMREPYQTKWEKMVRAKGGLVRRYLLWQAMVAVWRSSADWGRFVAEVLA